MPQSIKEKIVAELSKGDRYASQLKDACNVEYRELWEAIAELKKEEAIETYFTDTPPSATLTFHLKKKLELPHLPTSIQGLLPKPLRFIF
ncbi:hypothetical protein H6G36_25420 [Anabaena minutissima FACHB-250]|nr:hypothetical protein [Anabaena minutissima FACHB-250]